MRLETYEILSERIVVSYKFISEGPKGEIKKVVDYLELGFLNLFNLGLSDEDESTGLNNDKAISNNGDTRKVLATVAFTMQRFIYKYPQARILIEGNSASRIRLYRINISKYLNDILRIFNVYGLRNSKWELFERNISYSAFLITKKNNFI